MYVMDEKTLFLHVLIKFRQLNSYYGKERVNMVYWPTPA